MTRPHAFHLTILTILCPAFLPPSFQLRISPHPIFPIQYLSLFPYPTTHQPHQPHPILLLPPPPNPTTQAISPPKNVILTYTQIHLNSYAYASHTHAHIHSPASESAHQITPWHQQAIVGPNRTAQCGRTWYAYIYVHACDLSSSPSGRFRVRAE
ncbi:hypothetical protein IQ06DRAFT_19472 [Phaeosphaeriaceae sp. SRC1lsM3a]|nr:hypothetical protein IQ06DRAFT_19472 [Stagonospora sp. SRC1lsM3a]